MADEWRWSSDVVPGGGGARTEKPVARGMLRLVDDGLSVEPDDDFYGGLISPAEALSLARAIIAKFGSPHSG